MCNFRVGMKVVCVDDGAFEGCGRKLLKVGEVYTIRSVSVDFSARNYINVGGPYLWLEEITIRTRDFPYSGFRFRPVVERKSDISCFTKLLDRAPVKERA